MFQALRDTFFEFFRTEPTTTTKSPNTNSTKPLYRTVNNFFLYFGCPKLQDQTNNSVTRKIVGNNAKKIKIPKYLT